MVYKTKSLLLRAFVVYTGEASVLGHVLRAVVPCMMYSSPVASLVASTARLLRVQNFSTMRVDAKKGSKAAGKAVAKANLPSKISIVCNRPYTWYDRSI